MKEKLNTKQKLNLETATIPWKDLQICFAQGKLLIVEQSVDLLETATHIAENSTEKLEYLIDLNKVAFATPKWIKQHCCDNTILWAVVVAPYVMAQLSKESPKIKA